MKFGFDMMSNLKFLFCLLFVDLAQPQEATRTCSQSLMVALKTIYEQNANEVCVSHFFSTLTREPKVIEKLLNFNNF